MFVLSAHGCRVAAGYLLFAVILSASISMTSFSQTPESRRVGVVFVQFADKDTNVSARGGCGWIDISDPPDQLPDTLVNDKYRYKDLWALFFQEEGSVTHPDSASHSGYIATNRMMLSNKLDLCIHGSFRRYWKDVSYGLFEIVPGETRENESGIINHVEYEGTDPSEGRIAWITLGRTRTEYSDLYGGLAAADVRDDALDSLAMNPPPGYNSSHYDDIIVVYAGPSFGTSFSGVINLMTDLLTSQRSQFGGMFELVHEYGHQAVFGNIDLHGAANTPGISWVGSLSIMGDARPMCRLTPPHPDPWNKLKRAG